MCISGMSQICPHHAVSLYLSHLKCLSCASLRREDHAHLDDDMHEAHERGHGVVSDFIATPPPGPAPHLTLANLKDNSNETDTERSILSTSKFA
jgi:hypothetical protein